MKFTRNKKASHHTSATCTLRLATWFAVAMAPIAVLALSTPARAVVMFSNGFEGTQRDTWEGTYEGDAGNGFEVNQGMSHSGRNNGWSWARQGSARLGTRATVAELDWGWSCKAQIWIQPENSASFILRARAANGRVLAETTH